MFTSPSLSANDINPPRDLLQIYRSQVRLILTVCILTVIGLSLSVLVFYLPFEAMDISAQHLVIGLLAIHLVLHWLSAKVERRIRLAIIYLFVQITLLFFAQTLCSYPLLLVFLPPILAEIVVIFEALWLVPVILLFTYILFLINQFITVFSNPIVHQGDFQAILISLFQGMILALLGVATPLAACFLLIRSRRQTGSLLMELEGAHRQLAVYAEQVEQLTVTAERARMARELHDTLAQGIAGLILQLEALDSQIKRGDNETVAATLLQIKNRARATLKSSRQAIDDLRLMPNQPSMILDSIANEAHEFSTLTGVPCTLNVPQSLTLPTSTTEHTLRFVSEGLANIAKHAKATKVSLWVKVQERDILLEIQDDGLGFDPATTVKGRGHYGLLGLQERARLVGGKFEVESAVNKGTTLRLYLPKT